MPAFHLSGGLMFSRTEDGGVRIWTQDGRVDETTTSMGWASVVAAVSCEGETQATHDAALDLHMGAP